MVINGKAFPILWLLDLVHSIVNHLFNILIQEEAEDKEEGTEEEAEDDSGEETEVVTSCDHHVYCCCYALSAILNIYYMI